MTRPASLQREIQAVAALREERQEAAIYRPCLAEMPSMVRLLGLGQATATAMSADAEGWTTVLRHLEHWLCNSCEWSPLKTSPPAAAVQQPTREGETLLRRFSALDQQHVTTVEREALAFLAELHALARGLHTAQPAADETSDPTSPP